MRLAGVKSLTTVKPKTLWPLFFSATSAIDDCCGKPSSTRLLVMAKKKLKHLLTAFTPEGDYLAILSADGIVKVWNTGNGNQLAEWKNSDEDSSVTISYLACCFKQKKRRKGKTTCLVALGTDVGVISVLNISAGQIMWKSTVFHPSGIAHLSFTNEGHRLCAVGTDGMIHEMDSETGELTREIKFSKKMISSAAILPEDGKMVAAVGNRIRVFSLEDGKELLKLSSSLGPAGYISASRDAKVIVFSGFGVKHLQVCICDFNAGVANSGPVLSMKHPPISIECKNVCNGEDGLVVLSVSESGVAYLWSLKSLSEEVNPTKITAEGRRCETESQKSGKTKKNRIIAAKVQTLSTDGQVRALVAYGSVDSPQFTLLDITSPGEDITIATGDETIKAVSVVSDDGINIDKDTLNDKEKAKRKRTSSDLDILSGFQTAPEDPIDGTHGDYDLNEPTIGEKLSNLNLMENAEPKALENMESSSRAKPPSADSVHVVLKQALHADDRALLIDCLCRQDEKVVINSVSKLNSSDVLKLLQSLVSIIQSRGAVLACALPWLRSLLLQHASGIMSQESSLLVLNSLYQLIESRVSTFNQALKLSSSLDLLYAGNIDEVEEKNDAVVPVIYEDNDESDEEVNAMDTESDGPEQEPENLSSISDFEDME